MNSFHKSAQQSFCLLLVMVLNASLNALTCRNKPLTDFIEHGKALCGYIPENSIIMLDLENDNFDINHDSIDCIRYLKEVFQEIKDRRSGASFNSKFLDMSGATLNYNSSYLGGLEYIQLRGKTSLNFNRCLFESPLISITGNEINFCDCFLINPEILNIIIDYPGSGYDVIQLEFHKQSENPTIITGTIDLKNNETKKQLIISNVKEIRMQFVWDKILSEKVESISEDSESVQQLAPSISSTPSGFVARSRQAIVVFYKKYLTPYF